MKVLFTSVLIFLISMTFAESQIVNSWVCIDDSNGVYTQTSRTRVMSVLNSNKFIVFDQASGNTQPFLKYSSDGGIHWEVLIEPSIVFSNNFNSLAYPADNYMYVVGDSLHYFQLEGVNYNMIHQAMIYSSYDNGKSWNQILFDTNSYISYFDMCDSITGVAVKSVTNNKFNTVTNNGDTIIWTNDGFKTYEKITLPSEGFTINNVRMINENTFILNVFNTEKSITKYIITKDKGNTWEDMFNSAGFISNAIINENIAFVVQKNPNSSAIELKRTIDGGKNWELCSKPVDNLSEYSQISAFDENNIIFNNHNAILYKSSDGGKNWVIEYLPYGIKSAIDLRHEDMSYIDYIEYKDANNAFAVFNGQRLFKMSDTKVLDRPRLAAFDDLISPIDIHLNWDAIESATSYRYQMAISKSGVFSYATFDDLYLDTIVESNQLILPELEYNKCYYTRIKAIGDNIESDWYLVNINLCTFIDSTYVGTPKFIKPIANTIIGGLTPQIIWTSIPEAKQYEFQMNYVPMFTGDLILDTLTSDTVLVYKIEQPFPYSVLVARVRVNDSEHLSNWRYIVFYYDESVGIKDIVWDNGIFIYPNPATNYINIQLEPEFNTNIQIYNLMGIELITEPIQENAKNHIINIEKLPAGTYYIKIGERVQRFIKM